MFWHPSYQGAGDASLVKKKLQLPSHWVTVATWMSLLRICEFLFITNHKTKRSDVQDCLHARILTMNSVVCSYTVNTFFFIEASVDNLLLNISCIIVLYSRLWYEPDEAKNSVQNDDFKARFIIHLIRWILFYVKWFLFRLNTFFKINQSLSSHSV